MQMAGLASAAVRSGSPEFRASRVNGSQVKHRKAFWGSSTSSNYLRETALNGGSARLSTRRWLPGSFSCGFTAQSAHLNIYVAVMRTVVRF